MKKVILICICLQLVSRVAFSQNSTQRSQKWSLEEVKSMVKKYNLQDSVTTTNNNGLMYADKSKIEEWCQVWSTALDQKRERASFARATQKVKNRADYYKILEAHPAIRQIIVDIHGGELGYRKFKSETLKSEWRIYRNKKGDLAFRPANSKILEEEKSLGERVDNLPREKE